MRAAKLAAARQKLRDHQEKKQSILPKEESASNFSMNVNLEDTHLIDQTTSMIINKNNNNFQDNCFNIEETDNIESNYVEQQSFKSDVACDQIDHKTQANEILIMDNRKLEAQASNLHNTIAFLENKLVKTIADYENSKQYVQQLEKDLNTMKGDYARVCSELTSKDNHIDELKTLNRSLDGKLNEILDQFDFTKTTLIAKQNENASLQNQLSNLQSQLDIMQLHLQQLTNGRDLSTIKDTANVEHMTEQNQALIHKVSNLEQKLKCVENEHDQRVVHYEQYVNQLNEQLKDIMSKNSHLSSKNENLANRENFLVDQISDMEKQLQNLREANIKYKQISLNEEELFETREKYNILEDKWNKLQFDYDKVREELAEAATKIQELTDKLHHSENLNANLDISKLNADITSDKVAAQRAIAQNQKLKKEIDDLQEAFLKMSKDKLELVEKLDAEKFLNRELTIKLSEGEDKSNDLMPKMLAKDNEMIRLQAHCSELEKQLADQKHQLDELIQMNSSYKTELTNAQQSIVILKTELSIRKKENIANSTECTNGSQIESSSIEHTCANTNKTIDEIQNDLSMMSIEEAMLKLQERFLKKMKQVAELSDEKQQLEHLVMQLQNETDTICEYVALYQQQRGILKKREDERNTQIKFFENERERMKTQLDELTKTISKLAEDSELQKLFEHNSKKEDVYRIHQLVTNIKNNHFIKSNKQYTDFEAFHPCAWCSGKLIDV